MPGKDKKILKHNPGEKSLKVLFMIYADLECFLRKIDTCQNNPKNLLLKKKLSIHLQVTHGLHAVHLIHQNKNGVITEEKNAWNFFVKI